MTAPAAECAIGLAASAPSQAPFGRGIPQINPLTGLSTDYLNHFTEIVMALEMAIVMPELLDDLRAWKPMTYCEHFAVSGFTGREAVIAAYKLADPAAREALEDAADTLNTVLSETRDVVLAHLSTPLADALARRAVAWLRPLIARTAAAINGTDTSVAGGQSAQAAIDAIFAS